MVTSKLTLVQGRFGRTSGGSALQRCQRAHRIVTEALPESCSTSVGSALALTRSPLSSELHPNLF